MFLVTVVLVLAAVVSLVVGLIVASSIFYLIAAACSAVAVIILWRFLSIARERTFVTHAPPQVEPDWNRPVHAVVVAELADDEIRVSGPPVVSIDGYEDLVAAEILPTLETLSVEELQAVIKRERYGLKRQGIITRAERLIDLTRGDLDVRAEEKVSAPTGPSSTGPSSAGPTPDAPAAPAAADRKPSKTRAADRDLSI